MTSFNKEEMLEDLKDWHLKLKQFQVPNTRKAIIQILNSFSFFIGLWILQFYLFEKSVLLTILVGVLNGFILGRIFIIQHDCGHKSFTRSRLFNDIVGTICSFCTFIPYKYWAKSHDFHHAHNGQLEVSDMGDVQCLTTEEYSKLSLGGKIRYRVYRNPLYLFTIGGFIYVTFYNRFAFIKDKSFDSVRKSVTFSNIVFILGYILMGWLMSLYSDYGLKGFFGVQLINLFFFGTYALWFFYIQHQYEKIYKSSAANWNYVVSALRGSTYYDLPRIGHWLTGNIGYHHIHHLSPAVPNYNLRACNLAHPVFEKHTHKISIWESFKTVYANLWDDEKQEMISFREYKRRKNAKVNN
jgi:omega-6 fatty acid desaturase (delta-12 desaturase)